MANADVMSGSGHGQQTIVVRFALRVTWLPT